MWYNISEVVTPKRCYKDVTASSGNQTEHYAVAVFIAVRCESVYYLSFAYLLYRYLYLRGVHMDIIEILALACEIIMVVYVIRDHHKRHNS